MYSYSDKSKYHITAESYPCVDASRIQQYNTVIKKIEQLSAERSELESQIQKQKDYSLYLFMGSGVLVVVLICFLLLPSNWSLLAKIVVAMLGSAFVMGLSEEIVEGYYNPSNPKLEEVRQSIAENTAFLDNELQDFSNLEKKQAQHWLSMNGWQFEKEVAKLYEAHGYEAVVTKGSDDGGIDIFLTKDGVRLGVQCKNYHKPVAQVVIRELLGAMSHENLDEGIVIASSGYTKRAKEFADNKPIELLNINDVLRMHADTLAMNKEYFVPDCPKCGSKDVAEHIYGLVDVSYFEELESQGHKFIFEGCMIDDLYQGFEIAEGDGLEDDEENDYRNYSCNTCSNSYTWRDWRAKQVKT